MINLATRKTNRLKNYDYSQNGAYFITICTKDRCELLWRHNVGANSVRPQSTQHLSKYGLAIDNAIKSIVEHYPNVLVDKYVIMPNHIHIILILHTNDGRTMFAPTVSRIIKQMKENVTKHIEFTLWQKSFYDHIIRNEMEYIDIWNYIDVNPINWEDDCFY